MQLPASVPRYLTERGGTIMRTLGTIAAGSAAPAAADWYYGRHHPHYYNYGGGRERGMAAGLAGPSRVASVSPIDTVHGTCMDRHQATSDGGADILEAASLGRPLHFYHAGKGRLVCERWWRRSRWRGLAL